MSSQQDIYAAGFENRPLMLNKENYVPRLSRLLGYAKSRPNGKLIHNSIINGPHVRRMIPEPGDINREVLVNETFHVKTDRCRCRWLEGNGETQFRQYAGHNTGNLNGYNAVQNVENQVAQNAIQNQRVQNVENQNGLIGVPGNANQNRNGNLVAARAEGNATGHLVAARAEGNATGHNGNQIRNCTVRPRRMDAAYLQTKLLIAQKEEAGIHLQTKEFDLMAAVADLNEIEEVNINALHLSSGKQIMTLNEEISDLNKQLSKEKSTVSFLLEEKKKLKSDFKIHEDELLDKQIQLEKNIKELDNILVKTGQSIQTIHMLSPKPYSFYHIEQKMALGYQNPFYLKQAQKKQHSLYDGKVLHEKHDPPVVYDSEETLQLAQETKFVGDFKSLAKEADESLANHKALELEIEHLLRALVSQDIMSVVQTNYVGETSNLQTELKRTKERFENYIIKKENEYAKLWNDWYKKCAGCKFDNISYDKAYNDMQQKIKRLQAQLGDLQGKSKDTLCVLDTLNPLSQKLENENVELEFQTSREEKHVPNTVRASARTKPITVSQPSVITKNVVNSDSNGLSFRGVDNTKTRRPQPRSNTKKIGSPLRLKVVQARIKKDADRVVALTFGSAITIPETAKKLATKVILILTKLWPEWMTIKMDAQYKELQSRAKQSTPDLDDDDMPMSSEEEAKFTMITKQLNLGVGIERMIFNIDSTMKHSYSNDDTCFSIDVIDEILEEDFDALLDEGNKILHSVE
nr:reverse transcriptase domain-containing protein [Tanacetum cinerariifolium]